MIFTLTRKLIMLLEKKNLCDILEFSIDKTLICFGAGKQLLSACCDFADMAFFDRIDFIADNNPNKQIFVFEHKEKVVYSIDECLQLTYNEPVILITILDCIDVIEQLNNIAKLNNCYCFIYSLAQNYVCPYLIKSDRSKNSAFIIPKLIHYCWFGGHPIPDDLKSYMKSWKKFCPNYEIVLWNENNYNYQKNVYMYEAYKHNKWGFVSDYARLDIVYRYGGVYLDTDVELIRNIDDLLYNKAFCGFESRSFVANGLGFGAIEKFPLILEQMKIYDNLSFLNDDGSLNLKTSPQYHTELLHSKGLILNNTLQEIEGMIIYPTDVLSPYSPCSGTNITSNTYAIHHYAASWFDDEKQYEKDKIVKQYEIIRKSLKEVI